MPSIFDQDISEAFVARLSKLTPETPARWGKFTATKMIAHVNDAMRMATGDLPVRPKRTPFKNAFMRWLIIHVAPFPKGAPTAPELLARCDSAEFAKEVTAFRAELGKVVSRKDETHWPDHPAFGSMSRHDWGVLGFRHTDHHFRQFGI
jgi:hypothetical protein